MTIHNPINPLITPASPNTPARRQVSHGRCARQKCFFFFVFEVESLKLIEDWRRILEDDAPPPWKSPSIHYVGGDQIPTMVSGLSSSDVSALSSSPLHVQSIKSQIVRWRHGRHRCPWNECPCSDRMCHSAAINHQIGTVKFYLNLPYTYTLLYRVTRP